MSEGVNTEGLTKVQGAIANLMGPLLTKFKGRATYSVAGMLKKVLRKEPGESHSPVLWASEKQRRWYFAARRKANLPLKYTRETDAWSKQILKKWGITRQPTAATLGNRAPYATYVQSREYQTRQHAATGWVTDEQAVEQIFSDGTVKRIIEAQVTAIVREAFRGLT